MLYISVIIVLLLLMYFYDYRQEEKMRTFWYVVMLIVFICIAGLRYRVGTDSLQYEMDYQRAPTLTQLNSFRTSMSRYAIGYLIFQAIPRSISPDFTLMQFWHALWLNCIIFWFFRKYTPHIFSALLFYALITYLNFNMQIMRESMAVAMFLLAFPWLVKRNWLMYYVFATLAFGFHISAFILFAIPLIFLPKAKNMFVLGKQTLIIGLIILCVGFLIQSFLLKYIQMLAITDAISERAKTYAGDDISGMTLNIFGITNKLIQKCLYPAAAIYLIKKGHYYSGLISTKGSNNTWHLLESFTILYIYASLFSIPITIFMRYENYFILYFCTVLSICIFKPIRISKKEYRLKFPGWLLAYVPLFFLLFNGMMKPINYSGTMRAFDVYYPYESRLNPKINQQRERTIKYIRGY